MLSLAANSRCAPPCGRSCARSCRPAGRAQQGRLRLRASIESSVDLKAHRADSELDELDLGDDFKVRAVDAGGNADPSPAEAAWTVDTVAPTATIASGPAALTTSKTAVFGFSADEPVASYSCRVDAGNWTACSSPRQLGGLADGAHSFEVRATDRAGNIQPTPARAAWTVDTVAPKTTIAAPPPALTNATGADIAFSADDPGASFQCRVDNGVWASCTSPRHLSGLADGAHSVDVRASDAAGNVEVSPPRAAWTVDTRAPQTTITAGPSGEVDPGPQQFSFSADDPAATFSCRIDDDAFAPCSSPYVVADPAAGAHTFEVRAGDPAGNVESPAAQQAWTTVGPLTVATTALHDGTAGLLYADQLTASGGTAPYSFDVSGVPAGLTADEHGGVSGSPSATGTAALGVTVTDAHGRTAHGLVTLAVADALPADCMQSSCSHVDPDGQTVAIDGATVTAVARDPDTDAVTSLTARGTPPSEQQIVTVSPTDALPSGLIALVTAVATHDDGTYALSLAPASPADAYASGTVQALGTASPKTDATPASSPDESLTRSRPTLSQAESQEATGAGLACDSGVTSDLHGVDVVPSLTPALAAIWKHPYFGGHGIYPGSGGLQLFQFDLTGAITVDMGVSVSGKATCTLDLPKLIETIPAGDLGAVIVDLSPKLELKVDGKIDERASITLACHTEYRWSDGQQSRSAYCEDQHQPLRLSADSGVQATATAELDASLTLDDIVGVDGDLKATLHAAYTPASHPIAELDASADYELGACLACFWDGTPAHVQIVSGTLFQKTLATYDSAPPAPSDGGLTTRLGTTAPLPPDATVGSIKETPSNRFLATFSSSSNPGVAYLGYLESDGKFPISALLFPTYVSDLTFGPDGTVYATLGSLASFEGGELAKISPGLDTATQIHSWGAAPDGDLREPLDVAYLNGMLYVDALSPHAWGSCDEVLSELTTAGAEVTSVRPPVDCGTGIATAPGHLSVLDEGYSDISWLDPSDLTVLSRQNSGVDYPRSDFGAADGSRVEVNGSPLSCGTPMLGRFTAHGPTYRSAIPPLFGLAADDGCTFDGALATPDGRIRVLATDLQGVVLATIDGDQVTRSVIGPADAIDVHVAADGSGALIVTYSRVQSCTDPSGRAQQCTSFTAKLIRDGASTTIAAAGGTYDNSIRAYGYPSIVDGKVLVPTQTGPYFCGTNCTPFGVSAPAYTIHPTDVKRQAWHDPS